MLFYIIFYWNISVVRFENTGISGQNFSSPVPSLRLMAEIYRILCFFEASWGLESCTLLLKRSSGCVNSRKSDFAALEAAAVTHWQCVKWLSEQIALCRLDVAHRRRLFPFFCSASSLLLLGLILTFPYSYHSKRSLTFRNIYRKI